MRQHAQPQVVEVEPSGVVWVKSSISDSSGQGCVELSRGNVVMIRDSRDRNGPHLSFPRQALQTFLSRAHS